ncbi:hypothetical protein P3W85_02715 [Cupriavidus basilensis]|uniref:Uncharacterized protein n=1 Tax=Cupriavidus basilensis TaxID=68895 RepID=A0ABT6AGZ6_9BURK|nr:hypothetical protein [Cupriavidus basilensis]MDF3831874.1 hypothetical protein [Cupriavidus basilensis]
MTFRQHARQAGSMALAAAVTKLDIVPTGRRRRIGDLRRLGNLCRIGSPVFLAVAAKFPSLPSSR